MEDVVFEVLYDLIEANQVSTKVYQELLMGALVTYTDGSDEYYDVKDYVILEMEGKFTPWTEKGIEGIDLLFNINPYLKIIREIRNEMLAGMPE